VWEPAPTLSTSAELWLTAGGPHHTVLTAAVGAETLGDFAQMVHTEILMIDQQSTPAAFGDRVRWNQAYYRLAQGLPGRG
jgi:L-arabinose isomerase